MSDYSDSKPLFTRTYGHSTNKPPTNSLMTFDITTNTAGWDDIEQLISNTKLIYENGELAFNALKLTNGGSVLYESNEEYSAVAMMSRKSSTSGYDVFGLIDSRYSSKMFEDCTNLVGIKKPFLYGRLEYTKLVNLLPNIIDSRYYGIIENNENYHLGGNEISLSSIRHDIENNRLYSGVIEDVENNVKYKLQDPYVSGLNKYNSANIMSYEIEYANSKDFILGGYTSNFYSNTTLFSVTSYNEDTNKTTSRALKYTDGIFEKYTGNLSRVFDFTIDGKFTSFQPTNGSYEERFIPRQDILWANKIENDGKSFGAMKIDIQMGKENPEENYYTFPANTTALSRVFSVFSKNQAAKSLKMAVLVKNNITNKKQIYGMRKVEYDRMFAQILCPEVDIDGTHYQAFSWGERTVLLGLKLNYFTNTDIDMVYTYDPYDSYDGTAWTKVPTQTAILDGRSSIKGVTSLPYYSSEEPAVVFTLSDIWQGTAINAHICYSETRWAVMENIAKLSEVSDWETFEDFTVTKEGANYIFYLTYSIEVDDVKKSRVEKIIINESDIIRKKTLFSKQRSGSRRTVPLSNMHYKFHGSISNGNTYNNGERTEDYLHMSKSYLSPAIDFKRRMKISKMEIPFQVRKNNTIPVGLSIFIRNEKNQNLKICDQYTVEDGLIIFDINYEFKSGRYNLYLMTKNKITTYVDRPFYTMLEAYDTDSDKVGDFLEYNDINVYGNSSYDYSDPSLIPSTYFFTFLKFFSVFRLIEETKIEI